MKNSTAKTAITLIVIATGAALMAMPTIIHQLAMLIVGLFALLAALALFLVGQGTDAPTEQVKAARSDAATINTVSALRAHSFSDEGIAKLTGIDIDVVRAIP